MNRIEFLAQLRKALETELDGRSVKEHIDYYDDYIRGEVEKGQSEEEVLEHLGDPWALAKTILLSEKMEGNNHGTGTGTSNAGRRNRDAEPIPKWKVAVTIFVLVVIVLAVLSATLGILSVVVRIALKFAVPILVIVLIVNLFKKK